jgi:hypothetical protein
MTYDRNAHLALLQKAKARNLRKVAYYLRKLKRSST